MRLKPTTNLAGLLRANYPQTYRIAVALGGDMSMANKVARRVLRRAPSMYRTWETDEDAARWFARFTVMNTRGHSKFSPKRDALLRVTDDQQFLAVVYAVRQLPMQQHEAFLLHHGQCMDLRALATAMDCSTGAASTHLNAATKAVRQLAPAGLGDFTLNLPRLLGQLVPPSVELEMQVLRVIRRRRLMAILRYGLLWPAMLILLGVIAWEGYRFWKMIVI